MSVTFWTGDESAAGLNLSNANAADLLAWLGYERDELAGELAGSDLAARCRRRLWPEARNIDPGRETVTHASPGCATVIECGRPQGYLRDRAAQLLKLAESGAVVYFG